MLMHFNGMTPSIPHSVQIGPDDFCEIFPYHIVFDSSMNLKQAGIQIQLIIQGTPILIFKTIKTRLMLRI